MVIMPGGIALETGVVSETIQRNSSGDTDASRTTTWKTSRKFGRQANTSSGGGTITQETQASIPDVRPVGNPDLRDLTTLAPSSEHSAPSHSQPMWQLVPGIYAARAKARPSQPEGPAIAGERSLQAQQERKELAEDERYISRYVLNDVYRYVRENPEDKEALDYAQEANRALFPKHVGYLSYEEMPQDVRDTFEDFSNIWIQQESDMAQGFFSGKTWRKVAEFYSGLPLSKEWKAANELFAAIKKADPAKARGFAFGTRPAFRFLLKCSNDVERGIFGEEKFVFDDTDQNDATWEKKGYQFIGRTRDVHPAVANYDRQIMRVKGDNSEGASLYDFQELTPEQRIQLAGLFKPQDRKKPGVVHPISLDRDLARDLDFTVVPAMQLLATNALLVPGAIEAFLRFPEKYKWRAGGPGTILSERTASAPAIAIVRPKGTEQDASVMPTVVIDGSLVTEANEEGMRAFFNEHFPGANILFNRRESGVGIELAKFVASQRVDDTQIRVMRDPFHDDPTEEMAQPQEWDPAGTLPIVRAHMPGTPYVVGQDMPSVASRDRIVPQSEVTTVQEGRNIVAGSSPSEWVGLFGYTPRMHERVRERVGRLLPEGAWKTAGAVGGFIVDDGLGDALRSVGHPEGIGTLQKIAVTAANKLNSRESIQLVDPTRRKNPFEEMNEIFFALSDRENFPRGSEGAVAQVVRNGDETYLAVKQLDGRNPYNVYMAFGPGHRGEVLKVSGKEVLVPFSQNTPGERTVLVIPPIQGVAQEKIDALASSVIRMSGKRDVAALFNAALKQWFGIPPVAVGVIKVAV